MSKIHFLISSISNIPSQVNESVLRKVIEWCEHHKNDPAPAVDDDSDSRKKTTDIEEWDQKFMQVDQEMLFEIILVSKKLNLSLYFTDKLIRHLITLTSSHSSTLVVKLLPI